MAACDRSISGSVILFVIRKTTITLTNPIKNRIRIVIISIYLSDDKRML